jgi:ppGpp synthetase/RelA/SpoT-type nucleotidyltranferase
MVDYLTVFREKLLIEIQVMSPTMYQVMEAEHDLLYKQLHGKPTAKVDAAIERMYNNERQIAEESKELGRSLQNRQTSVEPASMGWGSMSNVRISSSLLTASPI